MLLLASVFAAGAAAQNTSSVSSPTVTAGDRGSEYRLGWTLGENGRGDSFAHRLDYSFALNNRRSLKFIVSANDRAGRDLRFSSIAAEYLIEITPETARTWQSAIRFDARLSNGSGPEQIGADWINRWIVTDRFSVRGQLVTSTEFGDRASDGLSLEVRGSLNYKLDGDYKLALLSFNKLGTLDSFGTGGQRQQLGPAISGSLGNGWGWTAGNLFGVSDDAPDNDIRFWISKDF